ncbi:unnamed protein product [Paramecium primaurelia]|uniref:Uncharacterized protein n=1 Tax=Paramecium primaurelia TaxID=5886 RepID=A0A8S1PE24_PARPR|nr:unnamed protein product [Paramecium primaurelia]
MQSQSIGEDYLVKTEAKGESLANNSKLNKESSMIEQETNNNIKLIPDDKEKFFEIILKEQQMRLDKKYQDMYGQYPGNLEDMIRSEVFKQYGYDDCPSNHKLYYVLTQKYRNDPELKKQVFFWRNNVMQGCRLSLNQEPPKIQLFNLQSQRVSLKELMLQSHQENRLLVVYSAIADYIAFAQKYKDICKCIITYVKEAHFVERDEQGKFVDGWPIGFYEYEYPQHKSQKDRQQMAKMLQEQFHIPKDLDVYQDQFPDNLFDESFGIWPFNMVVFKECKFIWRGILNLEGLKEKYHSKQLENHLQNLKY